MTFSQTYPFKRQSIGAIPAPDAARRLESEKSGWAEFTTVPRLTGTGDRRTTPAKANVVPQEGDLLAP